MGASVLVNTWTVDTSGDRTCVIHRLHWWEDLRREGGCGDGERKRLCPCRSRNADTHIQTRAARVRATVCEVRRLTHARQCTDCELANRVAEVTGTVWSCIYSTHYFLKDRNNQGKKEIVSELTRLSFPSVLHVIFERGDMILTKLDMIVTPLEDTRT